MLVHEARVRPLRRQDNTVLFQLEGTAIWSDGGDGGADRIELSGVGTCIAAAPCTLPPVSTASPVLIGATATLKFLANSSRAFSPRRPVVGGRFAVSYTRLAATRRAAISGTQAGTVAQSLDPMADREPLLRMSVSCVPGGLNPPCTFAYGAGTAVMRLERLNITTALEGNWNGTTRARVAPGGPFVLVSAGRCLLGSAGGPGIVLANEVAPGVEACATQCVG